MSNLHGKRISLICEQLQALSKIKNNREVQNLFEKDDFLLRLNFKLFSQITYFLLQTIDNKLATKLPWPVGAKEKDAFINKLLRAVHDVNERYSWAEIPTYLKSQFTDPRCENDKVVEFLLGLCTTAAFIATGTDGEGTLSTLENEIGNIKEIIVNVQAETKQLSDKAKSMADANKARPSKLKELKQQLVKEGVVASEDEATLEELMKVKEKSERTMLEKLSELQNHEFMSHLSGDCPLQTRV